MTATAKTGEGGSFEELRDKHLPLFDQAVHRHDRGWAHEPPRDSRKGNGSARRRWKTVGIFHFRHDQEEHD